MKTRITVVALDLLVAVAVALHAPAEEDARRLARDIPRQLIDIDTTEGAGNTTTAAQAMAARLKEAGFPCSLMRF